jgi:SAM-dependent methyltransferase
MKYDWKDAGEEWSQPWGSSAAQWSGAILPRIRSCLPAHTILEIGAGFGRWTHFLRDHCERLLVLDRAPECVEACRERFADDARLTYHVNDGRSLSMFDNDSIDFAFSFDSLVHPNAEIVEAYVRQLATKLKIGGRGFLHHSNFGEYANTPVERLPPVVKKVLRKTRLLDWPHNRNPTMSAARFRECCDRYGLTCETQELVNWRGRRLIDCFSLFARADRTNGGATRIIRNTQFMAEAERIRRGSI